MSEPEAKKTEAYDRMSRLAVALAAKFGPMTAGEIMIACGLTLLQGAGGLAPEYLREVANEIERPGTGDVPHVN